MTDTSIDITNLDTSTVRLDKSRRHGVVHGERLPDDPHYHVHFWQDGFPFGVSGELVHDDNRQAPFAAKNSDDKPIVHHPLWTDLMRKRLVAKLERSTRIRQAVEEVDPNDVDTEDEVRKAAAADVNFEMWLRGEVDYEWWQLTLAAKTRYSKIYADARQLVIDLVDEQDLVPTDQVCNRFKNYLAYKAA